MVDSREGHDHIAVPGMETTHNHCLTTWLASGIFEGYDRAGPFVATQDFDLDSFVAEAMKPLTEKWEVSSFDRYPLGSDVSPDTAVWFGLTPFQANQWAYSAPQLRRGRGDSEFSSLKIILTGSSNRRRSRHSPRFSYSLRFPLSPAVLDSLHSPGLQAAHGCPNRR